MVTKELVKAEIEKVHDDDLELLYKIIKVFESPSRGKKLPFSYKRKINKRDLERDWHQFIEDTYGCLAEDPIERGDQGEYEIREEIL
jgi:hypothetical protein